MPSSTDQGEYLPRMPWTVFRKTETCWMCISGTDDILYIDLQTPSRRPERIRKYDMEWIDNKKANDIGPQYWIKDCLKIYKISNKVLILVMESMNT